MKFFDSALEKSYAPSFPFSATKIAFFGFICKCCISLCSMRETSFGKFIKAMTDSFVIQRKISSKIDIPIDSCPFQFQLILFAKFLEERNLNILKGSSITILRYGTTCWERNFLLF